jgi:hypothetical protein
MATLNAKLSPLNKSISFFPAKSQRPIENHFHPVEA